MFSKFANIESFKVEGLQVWNIWIDSQTRCRYQTATKKMFDTRVEGPTTDVDKANRGGVALELASNSPQS